MDSETIPVSASNKMVWIGRILSAIPVFMLLMSAAFKFLQPPQFQEGLAAMGWTAQTMFYIGIIEVACVVIYLFPRTAILGAILITGYLGGAVATHVRVGDAFFIPVVLGIIAWLGLWLRDPRLRVLLPLRS
jgi:hypothetical protein